MCRRFRLPRPCEASMQAAVARICVQGKLHGVLPPHQQACCCCCVVQGSLWRRCCSSRGALSSSQVPRRWQRATLGRMLVQVGLPAWNFLRSSWLLCLPVALHYTTCKHITPALPPHLVPPAAGAESLSIELNNKSSSPVSKSSSPASKGSSPLAVQLHQAASPKHVHGNSGGDAGRQGRRRRTLPPPSFVESLERLAALHRWAKQPQRWDAALVPPLLRLHASMRCPPQQSHHLLHCLVLVCVQGPQ